MFTSVQNEILEKRWKLFSATPLWNLTYDSSKLSHYKNRLTKDLAEKSVRVNFSVLSSVINASPIKITVSTQGVEKSLYQGIFLPWRTDDSFQAENGQPLCLPFLICSGQMRTIDKVNSILRKYFDCAIIPLQLAQHDLKWVMAFAVDHIGNSYDKQAQLVYSLPDDPSSSFHLSISCTSLKCVWSCIHDEDSSGIGYEEVVKLFKLIDEHNKNMLAIDLSYLNLKTILVPDVISIDSSGRILISEPEMLELVLKYLYNSMLSKNQQK